MQQELDWKPVNSKLTGIKCKRCRSGEKVWYRAFNVLNSDHQDFKCECWECGKAWWIHGDEALAQMIREAA